MVQLITFMWCLFMSELRKDGTSLELVQPGADELLIVPAKLSY